MGKNWVPVCSPDDIDEEDLVRFDYDSRTYCVYNTPEGFYATDGVCTHENEHLENGIVIDIVIECPLHQGRFDVRTGAALGAPVCINLKTYPVKIEHGTIYLDIG